MQKILLGATALSASAGASAHSGHHDGPVLHTLAHIWTHADHWLPAVGVITATAVAVALWRWRKAARQGECRRGE